ncbi:MAG TPA: hypothetical protein VGD60_04415 [Candidatus Acidoferrales bacterium]
MPKSPTALAPVLGFALASASALLALWMIAFGYATGGSRHDPLFLTAFRTGIILSVGATVFALIAFNLKHHLRWLILLWALAGVCFWAVFAFIR